MHTPTAAAEAALERGDYGQCLQLLEPLVADCPITDPAGAHVRMLMVTAWMGQGQEEKALSTCRLLTRCRDTEVRNRARQLLTVLEAPSLERPASWSMRLPNLAMDPQMGAPPQPTRRRRRQPPPAPPAPPTGPTQAAKPGFALVVLIALIALTLLLGGCGRLTAEIHLTGPDRVQLAWTTDNDNSRLLPWQHQFAADLKAMGPIWSLEKGRLGQQRFEGPILRGQEGAQLFQETIDIVANAAGVSLPAPELSLRERNWLLGIEQHLSLNLDLGPLNTLPVPALEVRIRPAPSRGELRATPHPAERKGDTLIWLLETGSINRLTLSFWRWNPLGVGSLGVLLLLAISLLLQRLRLTMGFGYPELPS